MRAMHGSESVYERYRTAGFGDTELAASSEGYDAYRRWLPEDRDAAILDFGCGGGEFLHFLGEQGYRRAQGIDFSAEQVRRCHERGLDAVEHVTDAAAWLDARKGQLSRIVMNDVLEHIPKTECIATLERLRRALAPGGQLLIKVPNCANVFGLVARYLDFTHEVGFTESSLRQVLVTAGFSDVEVTGLPVPLKLRPKRLAYWTLNRLYVAVHRAVYVAAVGSDAPRILSKLLLARAA